VAAIAVAVIAALFAAWILYAGGTV
jgi:hypothetical protein